MVKRKLTLLLLILSLLNLVFYVNVNTATTQNYIPRKVDFDRSGVPKNILVGSYVGGRSHVKPMLDVAAILIERGYNVRFFFLLDVFQIDHHLSFQTCPYLCSLCIGNAVNGRTL
jgi:hypothetical protein